jgi:transcriptional regulator with XRE-family HTH domain
MDLTRASFSFAKQLLDARVARRLSQEDVALAAAISVQTYRRLEAGVGRSSLDTVLRVLIALEVACLWVDEGLPTQGTLTL